MGDAPLDDALSRGRVLAGVELRLVHPETGAAVPHDGRSIGELELRSQYAAGQLDVITLGPPRPAPVRKPGVLEWYVRLRHPWGRAWIRAFRP